MGSIASSQFRDRSEEPLDNGTLPVRGSDPKIIAIGDALAKRRKLSRSKSTTVPKERLEGQKLHEEDSHSLNALPSSAADANHPYVVADWVAPHTPCVIRDIESDSRIKAIVYPGNSRRREFIYSGERLIQVNTFDGEKPESPITYSYDPYADQWLMIHDGITAKMQGQVAITSTGVLQVEIDESGTAREEHPDGSVKLVNNCFKRQGQRLSVPEMEFLNVVSHDLRTPLMSVQGLLTLFSSGALGELSEKAKTRVMGVEVEVARLIRLVNDLLKAGLVNNTRDNLTFEEVPVSELFDATVFALENLADQKNLKLDYAATDSKVSVNVDSFIRVMVNLVANAVKYSPEGETVKLDVQEEQDFVVISVQDYGKGISESDFERIFQSFQRIPEADDCSNGIGLGLAICKSIVEAHSGTIGLDSKPGEGTRFWVRIPNHTQTS